MLNICMQTSMAKDLRKTSLKMHCRVQLGHLMWYSSSTSFFVIRGMDQRAYNYIEK